jgi:hypothetical protein
MKHLLCITNLVCKNWERDFTWSEKSRATYSLAKFQLFCQSVINIKLYTQNMHQGQKKGGCGHQVKILQWPVLSKSDNSSMCASLQYNVKYQVPYSVSFEQLYYIKSTLVKYETI